MMSQVQQTQVKGGGGTTCSYTVIQGRAGKGSTGWCCGHLDGPWNSQEPCGCLVCNWDTIAKGLETQQEIKLVFFLSRWLLRVRFIRYIIYLTLPFSQLFGLFLWFWGKNSGRTILHRYCQGSRKGHHCRIATTSWSSLRDMGTKVFYMCLPPLLPPDHFAFISFKYISLINNLMTI